MQLFARVFAVFALLLVPGIIHAQTWRLIGLSGQLADDTYNTVYCWTNFASGAAFSGAYGATVDSDGNVYVSALGSGSLSKVTPAGAATTLGASVGSPVEIVVSTTTTNLYVASLNTGVKKVVPPYGAGDVTTIDSTYTCIGVGVDSASDTVYAGDLTGHTIRIISPSGGGSTLAGGGSGFVDNTTLAAARFQNPCGIAVVVSGGNTNLYVADRENNRIRKIDIGNNLVTTLAGGGTACADGTGAAAGFLAPTGVTLGPDGNLYVADQDNFVIRKITLPDGVVTTLGGLCFTAGNADGCGTTARFSNVGQVGVDSAGTLYVADRAPNSRVSKGTLTTLESFKYPDNTWFRISTGNGAVTTLFTGTFVPDSHSIGYCPVDGRAYHTGGSEAYRNNPCQSGQPQYLIPVRVHGLAFQDNQYMESVNLGITNVLPIYNANSCPNPDTNTFDCDETQNPPEGTGFQLPCWGLPAPAPSWQLPNYRRPATQLSGYQETGSNEVSSIRGMAWSTSSNLFYVSSSEGIFKMTKDGDCTFLARPAFTNEGVALHLDRNKGIAFVNVGGVTKLLVGHRDANFLMEVDPATGANIGEIAVDYAGGDGILGLAQDPVTGTLYGISHTGETTERDLITINPVTGATTLVGNMAMHIASIAFVPDIVITSITGSGDTLTITWAGAAGPTFSLQTTASLTPPVTWTPVATGLSGPSTTTSRTNSQGFFRITTP